MKKILLPLVAMLLGFVLVNVAHAASVFLTSQGGTATSTAQPNFVLIGKPDGSGWTQLATSSLGITGGSGTPGGASGTIQFNATGAFGGGNLSGDITGVGLATQITSGVIVPADFAIAGSNTIFGKNGGAGTPGFLTATVITSMLNVFGPDAGAGGVKGLAPATVAGDATKFLRGDGTWATTTGGSGTGVNGRSAYWIDPSTLGNGSLFDNGTVSGVNATSSAVNFLIQGTANNTPLAVASSTGAVMFNFGANGRLGIGTSTPAAMLHLFDTVNAGVVPGILMGGNIGGDSDFFCGRANNGDNLDNDIYTCGKWNGGTLSTSSSVFSIDWNGRMGVGTTSPLRTFSVVGSMGLTGAFTDSTSATGTLGQVLGSTGTSTLWVSLITGNSAWTIGLGSIWNATTSDRVGVGSTSPAATLTVQGSSTAPTRDLFSISSSTGRSLVNVNPRGDITLSDNTNQTGYLRINAADTGLASSTGILVAANGNYGSWQNPGGIDGVMMTGGGTTPALNGDLYLNYYSSGNVNILNNIVSVNRISMVTTGSSTAAGWNVQIGSLLPNTTTPKLAVGELAGTVRDLFAVGISNNRFLTVLASGNIGFGSSTPTSRLVVQGAVGSTTPTFTVASSTLSAALLTVLPTGNVGIGTSTPINLFSVIGSSVRDIISFVTSNGYQAFNILSGGQVMIGTTTPKYGLTVSTTTQFTAGTISRVVGYASNASTTVDLNTTDIATTTINQATTFVNPTGTVYDGQMFEIVAMATTTQTLFPGTIFGSSTDLIFPATIASGTTRFLFEYSQWRTKWDLVGVLKNY